MDSAESSDANDGLSGVVEIELPSRFDFVSVVRMIVASASTSGKALSGDRLDDLRWVTSEAVTNAIEANLANEEPGRVTVRCEVQFHSALIRIVDKGLGVEFPKPLPPWGTPERMCIEGGFGIPLMQDLSDEIEFRFDSDGTMVELRLSQ